MTPVTLVTGGSYDQREAAIAAALQGGVDGYAILEGLPGGQSNSPLGQALPAQRIARIEANLAALRANQEPIVPALRTWRLATISRCRRRSARPR